MGTTFTIKQIPTALADRLRARAEGNHRSLQRELLLILEQAARWESSDADAHARIAEPAAVYRHEPKQPARRRSAVKTGRLSLDELWQRARKLGGKDRAESADIIRRDRDARHSR